MKNNVNIPVITIDGGAGVGKGTTRALVARVLEFHELDNGVLYRAVGLMCEGAGTLRENSDLFILRDVLRACAGLKIECRGEKVFLDGQDRTLEIRSDKIGRLASVIAGTKEVREALAYFQQQAVRAPGLVFDGRNGASEFPLSYKYFLRASLEVRAERRLKQHRENNRPATIEEVWKDLLERDRKDTERAVAPLRPHPKALLIDTSTLTKEEVAKLIIRDFAARTNRRVDFGLIHRASVCA